MNVVTTLSSSWLKRQALATLALFAIAGWFYYDGYVAYPEQTRRFDAWEQWEKAGKTTEERAALASESGWKPEKPEKRFSNAYLKGQIWLGHLMLLCGVGSGTWLILSRKQKLTSDDEAFIAINGQRIAYSAVNSIDRTKWEHKGIAYAMCEINGKKTRITLDDYKFIGAEDIVKRAEQEIASRSGV